MKVLWSAYYEFVKNLRDIRVLIALIACPISIILLLGEAFDGKLAEDFKNRIQTGYVILDSGEFGKSIDNFIKTDEIKKLINAEKYNTEDEAAKASEAGKIENYFIVREDTSNKIIEGKPVLIEIEGKKNIELVQTILEGYVSKNNAYMAALSISEDKFNMAEGSKSGDHFQRIPPLSGKLPKAVDYYSVLTLLQVMTIGAILGIIIVSKNQESNIHIRLYSLPVSKWTVLSGKIIGSSLMLFFSCIVTMIFTKYVYGANWDGNLVLVSATLLVFSFLCIGAGILIHSFIKSYMLSMGVALLLLFYASIAGGAITPATVIPSLNFINPIYNSKVLIFGAIYNYPDQVMLKAVIGLLALLGVVYLASALKLRRVNYDNI